jgi:hypothetical protein
LPPMQITIDTDYLIVGAGAAGMAFTDELLSHSDATVTIVDRRHAPGGHWIDAYPHVRLHQPSAFYGVSSVPLGHDAIDTTGTNAGFYELASGEEIRAYFEHVMTRRFLPTGRVRYFPNCEYVGEHRFVSPSSGDSWRARVGRKLVDTTYMEGAIPATSPPPFPVADSVRWLAAGELARLAEPPERYVIIGAGKTALDTCVWLLERGVPAATIRWIRPRESWWMNRRFQQPFTMVPELYRGTAIQLEAMVEATSVDDLFARLEAERFFLRIDHAITPTMFRGAVVSEAEMALLRQIEDVVRKGHVRRIERDEVILDRGRIPTNEREIHVHCAARGLASPPLRPIFEPGRVTVQPFAWGYSCYQFAMLGVVEATVADDAEKNRLCPPIAYWDENEDYASAFLAAMTSDRARADHPPLVAWARSTRLNPTSGISSYRDDPRVIESRERIRRSAAAAGQNLQRILAHARPR